MKLYLQNAVAAIIKYKDKYLFQLRDKKKNIFFPEHWGLFGGAIDKNETKINALIREVKEELSIDISSNCVAPLAFAIDYNKTNQTILMLHICRKWQGSPESLLGQKLQWVRPINLIYYEMPRANVYLISMLRDWVAST